MPMNAPIEKLLDMFQFETISSEDEIIVAFKELVSFGTFKDKRNVVAVFNAIKKKIRTRAKTKEFFTVIIKQRCKICENIKLQNGLKISSGKIDYICNRCKGVSPKKDSCKKCCALGKISVKCPSCHGKKYVLLKRKVDRNI